MDLPVNHLSVELILKVMLSLGPLHIRSDDCFRGFNVSACDIPSTFIYTSRALGSNPSECLTVYIFDRHASVISRNKAIVKQALILLLLNLILLLSFLANGLFATESSHV
jgi:hypothetical protein